MSSVFSKKIKKTQNKKGLKTPVFKGFSLKLTTVVSGTIKFGGLLFAVIIIAVGVVSYGKFRGIRLEFQAGTLAIRWCLMIIPTLLYVLIVSKMAVYVDSRYVSPIYAVVLAVGLYGILCIAGRLWNGVVLYAVVAGVCAFMTVGGWVNADWKYLYRSSVELLDTASEYGDVDCVYVYDTNWKMQRDFFEVSQYRSVTFIPSWDVDLLASTEVASSERLIVKVMSNSEEVLEHVMDICPKLEEYDKVGAYGYGVTYIVTMSNE